MITPTIGRVVWFHPYATETTHAAIVVYVHSDTMVNLTIWDENGTNYPRTSVPLWNGEGERPDPHKGMFAEWPVRENLFLPQEYKDRLEAQADKVQALEKTLESLQQSEAGS